jgi:hypothetical protein
MKSTFITKIWFDFRQYMAGVGEVLVSLPRLMKELVLYYVYLFVGRVGKLVQIGIMGS